MRTLTKIDVDFIKLNIVEETLTIYCVTNNRECFDMKVHKDVRRYSTTKEVLDEDYLVLYEILTAKSDQEAYEAAVDRRYGVTIERAHDIREQFARYHDYLLTAVKLNMENFSTVKGCL